MCISLHISCSMIMRGRQLPHEHEMLIAHVHGMRAVRVEIWRSSGVCAVTLCVPMLAYRHAPHTQAISHTLRHAPHTTQHTHTDTHPASHVSKRASHTPPRVAPPSPSSPRPSRRDRERECTESAPAPAAILQLVHLPLRAGLLWRSGSIHTGGTGGGDR